MTSQGEAFGSRESWTLSEFLVDIEMVKPVAGKVEPFWIGGIDQGDFLFARERFDVLFAFYRRGWVAERFVIDKRVRAILLREAGVNLGFVFEDAICKPAGYAGVEDAGFACKDVDVKSSHGGILVGHYAKFKSEKPQTEEDEVGRCATLLG